MTQAVHGLSVLYVEDDENDVFFMRRAFAKLNLSEALQVTRDGDEGIAYLNGERGFADRRRFPRPNLMLVDVKMPGRSGLDVLVWIRERASFAGLIVVMFSSSTQQSDLAFCALRGADAYVVKPSRADTLDSLVTSVVNARIVMVGSRRQLDFAENLLLPAVREG